MPEIGFLGATMTTILFSEKDGRHRLDTELSMRELAAIGFVMVSWAQLEHLLLQRTAELADKAKVPIPTDATALSFKKRLRALRALAKEALTCSTAQKKFLNLLTRIGGAERSRNRITHGLWDWTLSAPDKLRASSFRPPNKFEEPFDLKKLITLAERIGELNFQLAYPGGKDQAWEELIQSRTQRGWHVSRQGMQLLAGKDISDVYPHLASPPKRKQSTLS